MFDCIPTRGRDVILISGDEVFGNRNLFGYSNKNYQDTTKQIIGPKR